MRKTPILETMRKTTPRKLNPARAYLDSLTTLGRASQLSALRTVAKMLTGNNKSDPLRISWHRVTYERAARVRRAILERGYAPSTANRLLVALRRTLREAWRLGLMDHDAYARAADVDRVRGTPITRGRCLRRDEVAALYRVCAADSSPLGLRDAAAIALMHAAGLRRQEVVDLPIEAVDRRTGQVLVTGKGDKGRTTFLGSALPILEAWIHLRGEDPGPLICPVAYGEIVVRPMCSSTVHRALERRVREAGLEDLTPHDLRRTFATELLEHGDVLLVRRLLGHESTDTTAKYDRRGLAPMRELQARLLVPWGAR